MTAHDRRVTKAAQAIGNQRLSAAHPLAELDPRVLARRLVVFTPAGPEAARLFENARRDIAGMTDFDVVLRVMAHNPDCFWAIARRDRFDPNAPAGEGFMAFLMLNERGMKGLVEGTLDTRNPDVDSLAAQNEKPAGVYIWAVHARGPLSGGMALAFEKIWTPLYRDAHVYARAVTVDGHRTLEGLGFIRGAEYGGAYAPHLHMYRRAGHVASSAPNKRRNAPKSQTALSVTVARSMEDLMRVMTIRAATYMSEQECPYAEEFDGNDFSASHLLGYVGDEPAGCMRIRYFADFAKIERLAVRKEFRRSGLARQIVRSAIELCELKGYRRLYAHSQKRLVSFWSKLGFGELEGGRELVFSDFDYVEMVFEAARHPNAISIGIDPYVIIRPEGRWHLPGILERSASRPARQFEGLMA